MGRRLGGWGVTLLLVTACEDPEVVETQSPSARPEMLEMLREDLATERHPSDGGGRAWIVGADEDRAVAGQPGRWSVVYEAGPMGVVVGGVLFFQVSPFWGWSTPQVLDPEAPGFTQVSTEVPGVELDPRTLDQQLLGIWIQGRGLEEGEQVQIVYGAGPRGAVADRFAERGSRFWIGVDGDGDGVRGWIADSPSLDVGPGPPARLVLTLPTTARPGEEVSLTLAVLDRLGNAGVEVEGDVRLHRFQAPETPVAPETAEDLEETRPLPGPMGGLGFPATVPLTPQEQGVRTLTLTVSKAGIYRLAAVGPHGLQGVSNPLTVSPQPTRVLWADLHGHSNFSDGTGTPEDYFRYARDVAALDAVALTDHDHWGLEPLSQNPEMWSEIGRQTRRFHEPGRFVTLLGYEWTSWLHGHRHVLYFGDRGQVLSSVDPAYESPLQLWDALRGEAALTFAHHSAGGPVATNWDIPPDPELEPVTEIVSVHGSSEASDSPGVIYSPVAGNFVRQALDRGYRLGLIGSGDSHDGHPGLARLASPSAGLAAILSEDLTRPGILEALRARRVYATNGPRILLEVSLGGRAMGSGVKANDLAVEGAPQNELDVLIVAEGPLEHVDLVRSGRIVETLPGGDQTVLRFRRPAAALTPGEYLYVRAVQTDGGAAWSSPFFVE